MHAEGIIIFESYCIVASHVIKAGPTAARVKLLFAAKDLLAAGGTRVHSCFFIMKELAATWRFGGFLAQNGILLRGELGFEFGVGGHFHALSIRLFIFLFVELVEAQPLKGEVDDGGDNHEIDDGVYKRAPGEGARTRANSDYKYFAGKAVRRTKNEP